MKINALWRVYLERVVLAAPAFWLLTFLWGNYARRVGMEWQYGRHSAYIMGMELAFTVGLAWHLIKTMRGEREHSFVNALPVTKGQQVTALAGVLLLLAVALTVIGEGQLYYFYGNSASLGDLLVSVLVKTAAVYFGASLSLWGFSHIMPEVGELLLWGSGLCICLGMLDFVSGMFQKIYGVPGNRLLYSAWNLWCILTVPIREYRGWADAVRESESFASLPATYQELVDAPPLDWGKKGWWAVLCVTVAIGFILLFLSMARRNFQAGDLARKRSHRPFQKAVQVVAVCALCSLCTGAVGGFYLQNWVEGSDARGQLSEDSMDACLKYGVSGVTGTDFRERRTYWGEEIDYHGVFWKYNCYRTESSGFAKKFAVDSVIAGTVAALLNYGAGYLARKRRRGD